MRSIRSLTLLAAVVVAVAACSSAGSGYGSGDGSGSAPVPAGTSAPVAGGVVVGTAPSAEFGAVLTGPTGLTLYTHAGDTATESTCTGSCAATWPPLETTGQPTAASGVTGKLGTAQRADGTTQVTYDGLPLYYWEGDTKAGDVTGDGVEGFSVATVSAVGAAPRASDPVAVPSSGGTYSY